MGAAGDGKIGVRFYRRAGYCVPAPALARLVWELQHPPVNAHTSEGIQAHVQDAAPSPTT